MNIVKRAIALKGWSEMAATSKQVWFIEKLLREREIDNSIYESIEARSIRCGMGDDLGRRQASRFIEMLLECPIKGAN